MRHLSRWRRVSNTLRSPSRQICHISRFARLIDGATDSRSSRAAATTSRSHRPTPRDRRGQRPVAAADRARRVRAPPPLLGLDGDPARRARRLGVEEKSARQALTRTASRGAADLDAARPAGAVGAHPVRAPTCSRRAPGASTASCASGTRGTAGGWCSACRSRRPSGSCATGCGPGSPGSVSARRPRACGSPRTPPRSDAVHDVVRELGLEAQAFAWVGPASGIGDEAACSPAPGTSPTSRSATSRSSRPSAPARSTHPPRRSSPRSRWSRRGGASRSSTRTCPPSSSTTTGRAPARPPPSTTGTRAGTGRRRPSGTGSTMPRDPKPGS